MKKKLLGILLAGVVALQTVMPAMAAGPQKPADSITVENGNKIQTYTTENGKSHTIYWAKGVDGPEMSGTKGSDGKYGDFTKTETKPTNPDLSTVTYSLAYQTDKGYYDLNKEDSFTDHRCYLAAAQNIIYWWLDQNSANIDEYLKGLKNGDFVYNDKLVTPDEATWAKVRKAPELEFSTEVNSNGAKAQYIDKSYIVKNYYGAYKYDEGYYMDRVMDFFINGYKAADYIRDYENRPSEFNPDKLGGFFFPAFGTDRLSKRYMNNNQYDFYKTNMKNWILNGQGITIAYGASQKGSHAISVWGAEYDEKGELCRIYITDSNDASNKDFKTNISDGIVGYDVTNAEGVAKIGNNVNKQHDPGKPIVMASTLDLGTEQWNKALTDTDRNPKEPVILEQPKGKSYGKNASAKPITIKAEVPDLQQGDHTFVSYQWYKSDADGNNGKAIEGAVDTTFTPSIGYEANKEYYYCDVTSNKYGKTNTIKSEVAEIVTLDENVTNAAAPKITTNIPKTKLLSLNQILSPLEVKGESPDGGTITYQWYESTNQSVTNGKAIKGATSNTYMPPTDKLYGTRYYYCEVTNTNENVNGDKVTSVNSIVSEVTMQIGEDQGTLSIKGAPQNVKKGDKFKLSAEGGSGAISKLVWEISSGQEYAEVDQEGNVTVTGDGTFTVKVTNHAVGFQPISDTVTFTINKTLTQFAPGVSKTEGWYDTNKLYGSANDSKMCWAASCSNSIAWYVDQLGAGGEVFEGNHKNIYKNFRDKWSGSDDGFDPLQGFSWYFTGGTTDGKTYNGTGGYFKTLKGCNEPWSVIPQLGPQIFGNNEHKIPYVYDEIGVAYEGAAFSTYELMSKKLIEQLKKGVCVLSVARGTSTSGWSHAITLWGVEYDENTGLVTKLYVTDSDDESIQSSSSLKELKVKRSTNSNDNGYRIEGYYLPGNDSPITKIVASTLLYKPVDVLPEPEVHTPEFVQEVPSTCTTKGTKAHYHCSHCDKNFEDINCTIEIKDLTLPLKDHDYKQEWNKDADKHWHECNDCHTKKDEAAHTFKWVIDRELTEELPGLAHEECEVCGYQKGQKEFIKAEDLNPPIIKPVHTPEFVQEVPSTCTTKGTKAHYHCSHCDKNFEDKNCTIEIEDLTLPLKDHDYKQEWDKDGEKHWHECNDCHTKKDEAVHTFKWVKDREPSKELSGLAHEECTVCGYKKAPVEYIKAEELNPPIVKPDPTPGPNPEPQPEPQPQPETKDEVLIKPQDMNKEEGKLTVTVNGNKAVVYDKTAIEAINKAVNSGTQSVKVALKETAKTDSAMKEAQLNVAKKDDVKAVFSISLIVKDSNGVETEIHDFNGGKATITVPYENASNAKLTVYRLEDDGTLTAMETSYSNGKLTWVTDKHSFYVVKETKETVTPDKTDDASKGETSKGETSKDETVKKPAKNTVTPPTGDTANVGVWVALIVLAAVAVIVTLIIKKKK